MQSFDGVHHFTLGPWAPTRDSVPGPRLRVTEQRAMNAYEGALHQAGVYRTDTRQQQGQQQGRSGEAYDGAKAGGAAFDAQWTSTPDSRSLSHGQGMPSASHRGPQPQEYSQESLVSSYPMSQSDGMTPGTFTSNSWPSNAQAQSNANSATAQAMAYAQIHAAVQANIAAGWTHPTMPAQDQSSSYSVCFVSASLWPLFI
jgi:hypothetical protein